MKTILLLAAVYCTFNGGDFRRAPAVSKVDGFNRATDTLTEAQANALGYKLLVDEPPPCASNEYAVATGYEERQGESSKEQGESEENSALTPFSFLLSPSSRIYRLYEKRIAPTPPRRWTPLSIKRSASKLGYWDALRAFLVAANVYDDFCMAQYEAEDDADFVLLLAAARAKFGSEMVDAILDGAEVER